MRRLVLGSDCNQAVDAALRICALSAVRGACGGPGRIPAPGQAGWGRPNF